MKQLRVLILLVLVVFIGRWSLGENAKQGRWSLKIVPSRSSSEDGAVIERPSGGTHFYVVLTNTSDENLSVWQEWCSWGYFCLSFEIAPTEGNAFKVKKKLRGWTINAPESYMVKPGGHFVFPVRLDECWEGIPPNWENQKVMLKAVYSVEEDGMKYADKFGVWLGKVESPAMEVLLSK